jgi:phage tail-like protein
MTITQERPNLRLQVTPLNLPDTPPQPLHRQGDILLSQDLLSAESSPTPTLVVYPAEVAELLIQLENLTPEVMQLKLNIEGNFPSQWYQILRSDDRLRIVCLGFLAQAHLYRFFFLLLRDNPAQTGLLPHEKTELIILWQIQADFFEFQTPLPQNKGLQLDYLGEVRVFSQLLESSIRESERVKFQIFIRPHSLYTNFLPEIYRNIDFIARLLHIFEQTLEPDVHILNSLWAYLEPMLTSEQFLPFLAHWLGWRLTPSLSLQQQRYLVRQAIELYRWRGTRHGLRLYLHLITGLPLDENLPEGEKHIRIEETFGQQFTLGKTCIGSLALIGGGQRNHFKVTLKKFSSLIIDEALVRQIIEQEKPAFSTYELVIN